MTAAFPTVRVCLLCLSVCIAMCAPGCATVDTYNAHVRTFREGYATAAPALGELYVHLDDFERQVYLTQASCDPAQEVLERTREGVTTPLGGDRFPPEFIQTRVDA